ncbi:MAG: hypothetical protein WAU70_11435 [Flavobacteriales bacterium]
MEPMKILLTCILLLPFTPASAQDGTLTWSDVERLTALDLSDFEKEIEGLGFRPDVKGNTNNAQCATLAYLAGRPAGKVGNRISTMRCNNGMRTLSFSTPDEAAFKKMMDAAAAEGFKLQPAAAGTQAQVFAHDGKQMRTDRSTREGVTFFTISHSGNWPK